MPPDKVAPDHKLSGPTYFAGYSLGMTVAQTRAYLKQIGQR